MQIIKIFKRPDVYNKTKLIDAYAGAFWLNLHKSYYIKYGNILDTTYNDPTFRLNESLGTIKDEINKNKN